MSNLKFARSIFKVDKAPGRDALELRGKSIIQWADKHEIHCSIGYNGAGALICEVAAEGKTSSYCRGMCAEVKALLQEAFGGKITTLLSAY